MDLLNDLFTRFDLAAGELGIEKIKTIGDAYMAVCGLPEACEDHSERILKLAQRLIAELTRAVETMLQQQQPPLLVTSPLTRPHVKRLTEPYVPQLVVLSHNDIMANVRIRNLGVVKV